MRKLDYPMVRPSSALTLASAALFAVALLPSPHWQALEDKALHDARLLSTFARMPDRISMALAQDATLLHAVLFDADGRAIYPNQSGFTLLQCQLSKRRLKELSQIPQQATGSQWLKFDTEGLQLLNCRAEGASCLIDDRTALEDQLEAPRGALIAPRTVPLWKVALAVMATISAILAIYLRTRSRSADTCIQLIPERHSAKRGALEIPLTPRDMKLMKILIERNGNVVTKDELYDAGWGREFMPNSRALDQHIVNLRKKMDPDQALPKLIETVRGVGYRLSD
jgi:hypothetical protein